ncbi:MAG TPA: peptide chain release factor 1 [Candidatus Pacearchaeota archaeon]|nr:peptide chain release factor 1 [Candidatus Paceibacterota bacterium]HOK00668.1 peptide chain release factor 1 [Candidatus Pacearchaeota archaeon]
MSDFISEIENIKNEYESILNELSNPDIISDLERFEELSKKKKSLEKILDKYNELEEIEKQIEENKIILISGEEPEILSLAEIEITQLKEKEESLKKELENLLKKEKEGLDFSSIIVEIRAGTGGEEACLFAADLYRMYSKFANSQGWKQKVLDSHPSELNGFKEIIFELSGDDVYEKMKNEAGVHRIQRIPETEKSGRVHTSTATVAILPKPKSTDIKIKPDDIKIDYFRSSGPGGQNVNKRETAVRITHIPTGIVVSSQTERNQLKNKENALSILAARLLEKKQEEEFSKIADKRKTQIGKAKRAEKIRTYNFPQNRITDHRIKKNFHNIEDIMEGNLEPIIKSLKDYSD